jgi:class 3 adenylate cyclase
MPGVRTERNLLIVFTNLSRFSAQSFRETDTGIADIVDAYYEAVGTATKAAGGTVVKFIGDGALIVFPENGVRPVRGRRRKTIRCHWKGRKYHSHARFDRSDTFR